MKLRTKLSLTFTVMLVILIGTIAVLSIQRETATLKEELKKQGLILTNTLANECKEAFLTDKFVHIMDYIDTISKQEYVVYVMVRDKDGKVRAHSDMNKVGSTITDSALSVIYKAGPYIETTRTADGQDIYVLAVPVTIRGNVVGEAQIGYSLKSLKISTARARKQIIIITIGGIIAGVLLILILSQQLVGPITKLKNAVKAIAQGGFDTRIDIQSKDEIGELSSAFNQMTMDLKTSRDELITAKDYTDNIIKSMIDTLIVLDAEGVIETANRATLDLLGYTQKELVGWPLEKLLAEESPFKERQLERLIKEGELRNYETYYKAKDGKTIPALLSASVMKDEDNNISYIVCTGRDISELKKAEKALAGEKEQLAVTLRSIGDGVITTDTEGKIVLINKAAEKLSGWPQGEAIGNPFNAVFHIINEKTRMPCDDPVEKVLKAGIIIGFADHTVLISRDGKEKIIGYSGAPIRDKHSKIIGVVLVFRDITEKRKMENELLKAQKIESVGILAGGIAHDFNNILTGILGNISLAKTHAKPGDALFKKLAAAEKASLQAQDLTQQLLTFSQGGAPVKKTTSIAELLMDTAKFASRGSNTRCEFEISDNLSPVMVDEGQISQVINNLIINADQAMPDGGIIKVRAENIIVKAQQDPALKEGTYVKISLEDQGVGIQKEHLRKIFDPYFTTKQKGNGLGLAIVYSIIKKHDGYIHVESESGVGTTFSLYLPASDERCTVKDEKSEKTFRGKGKILVMDDEDIVLEVAGEMVTHLGYKVELVKDGSQVVETYSKATATGEPFDAVIMDLTVPAGIGGKEAIQKLMEIDPEVKAIVSSGYSNDPVMADFKKYGFRGVIAKPYRVEELSETLHKVIMGSEIFS
jgi:PAS domain S-box-containing protein